MGHLDHRMGSTQTILNLFISVSLLFRTLGNAAQELDMSERKERRRLAF